MASKITSYKFIIFCMSVHLSLCEIIGIHVYIAYWVTPYKLGDGEAAPYERLKVSPKVNLKPVLDLSDQRRSKLIHKEAGPCKSWM